MAVNLDFCTFSKEVGGGAQQLQIQNVFEPEPSQAQILTSSPSLAEPAQLEHFGSSQLKLESARYSLVATEWQIVTDKTSAGRW